jgi:hypothetical protein
VNRGARWRGRALGLVAALRAHGMLAASYDMATPRSARRARRHGNSGGTLRTYGGNAREREDEAQLARLYAEMFGEEESVSFGGGEGGGGRGGGATDSSSSSSSSGGGGGGDGGGGGWHADDGLNAKEQLRRQREEGEQENDGNPYSLLPLVELADVVNARVCVCGCVASCVCVCAVVGVCTAATAAAAATTTARTTTTTVSAGASSGGGACARFVFPLYTCVLIPPRFAVILPVSSGDRPCVIGKQDGGTAVARCVSVWLIGQRGGGGARVQV